MSEKYTIDCKTTLFDQLESSAQFEYVAHGRKRAILVDCKNNLIPIVRTTTKYNVPAQQFLKIHYDIIDSIKSIKSIKSIEADVPIVNITTHINDSIRWIIIQFVQIG